MLKENWRFISRIEKIADFIIIIVAYFFAYYFRIFLFEFNQQYSLNLPLKYEELAPLKEYFPILFIAVVASIIFLNLMKTYNSMRMSTYFQIFRLFSLSSVFVFFAISACLFILKIDFSRSFIALYCLFLAIFLTVSRIVVLKFLRFWRRRGFNYKNVIICGISEQAIKLSQEINKRPELGVKIRCYAELRNPIDFPSDLINKFKEDLNTNTSNYKGRIIFGIPAIKSALREYAIDEIIFTNISDVLSDVEEVMLICAEQGVRTTIAADLFSIGLVKSGISYFGHIPLIHFQTPPGDRWELVLKRIFDIGFSAFLLILLAPLFLILVILIKFTSKGSTLFVQKRVGMNGHLFNMYKFRSMYEDAEEKLAELKDLNEMQGPAFKLKNDPRITPIGRFLRRHSLDELPQLWNVLIGDMSIVGPRPPVPGEVSSYERRYRRRLSMRPGLTCVWQVSGRNEINEFEDWVKLDLEYIDNWSLSRDFMLIFRTIPAIILGTGAR